LITEPRTREAEVEDGRRRPTPAPQRTPGRHRSERLPRRERYHVRRRAVPGTERSGMPAAYVVISLLVCFGVWSLLSAHTLRRSAEASPVGARRSAAMTVLGPLDSMGHAVLADRIAGAVERLVGRDPNALPGGGGGFLADPMTPLPPDVTRPLPLPEPPPVTTAPPRAVQPENDPMRRERSLVGTAMPTTGTGPRPVAPAPEAAGPGRGHPMPETSPALATPAPAARPPSTGPLRTPTAANPLRVLVVGDSFGEDVELGLGRNLNTRMVRMIPKALHSTGLSRPDYFNWPVQLRSYLAAYRADVVVVMIGANDPQALRDTNGAIVPFGGGGWEAAYRARVDRFMGEARSTGAHLMWVGLPVMGDPAYSARIHTLDRIYQTEAAAHAGVLYVDAWRLFADAHGGYTAYLPDAHGDMQVMRESDRIHLTPDGNDRLAGALLSSMERVWGLTPQAA
jgi:uncharacterized protein